jgi:hypothetical protein
MLPGIHKQHADSSYGHKLHNQEQQKMCMIYVLQDAQTSHIAVWFTSALNMDEKASPSSSS